MKKPIYKEYANQKIIIGYEIVDRPGASRKKNSRPKKYGRKLSTGFKK